MKRISDDGKILQLIENGESKTVEFKSTLRYCLRKNSPQKNVEHCAMKNLAAFLNTEGGFYFWASTMMVMSLVLRKQIFKVLRMRIKKMAL